MNRPLDRKRDLNAEISRLLWRRRLKAARPIALVLLPILALAAAYWLEPWKASAVVKAPPAIA